MKKCTVWFCNRPYYAKGHCHTHWTAQRRYGSPYGRHKEPFERIEELIDKSRRIATYITNIEPEVAPKLVVDAYSILELTK